MTPARFKLLCIVTAIVFVFIACTFVSCENCEPEMEYTVSISDHDNVMDMHGSLWNTYSSTDVRATVMDSLRRQFGGVSNLNLVYGPADIHILVHSIITDSYEWDESREDPCYGDHGWLYQTIHPPDVYTYRLHRTNVIIKYSVVDSVHLKTGWGEAQGENSEWLQQPSGDSTQCFQYEIVGAYDNAGAINLAVKEAFRKIKCEVKKMMEP